MRDRNPIAFYFQKLNTAQKWYTTTESNGELLSAIKACKAARNTRMYCLVLLGYHQPIIVFTDHKNNSFNGLKASDCVLHWLLLVEEYGVLFEYLTGKKMWILLRMLHPILKLIA
jgi:hypothetical protein